MVSRGDHISLLFSRSLHSITDLDGNVNKGGLTSSLSSEVLYSIPHYTSVLLAIGEATPFDI